MALTTLCFNTSTTPGTERQVCKFVKFSFLLGWFCRHRKSLGFSCGGSAKSSDCSPVISKQVAPLKVSPRFLALSSSYNQVSLIHVSRSSVSSFKVILLVPSSLRASCGSSSLGTNKLVRGS
jgi:hypothetical protein